MKEKKRKIVEISSKKELKKYLKPVYIIEDYTGNEEDFVDLHQTIRYILRGCFHIKECREYPINFRFYRKDKETYQLQLRRFLYNLYLWHPFYLLDGIRILDKSFIIHEEDIPNVNDFIDNKIIIVLQDYNIEQTKINRSVSEVLYNLRSISLDFSDIMNLTFSDNDFMNMWNDDDYRNLMTVNLSEDLQPVEIEKILNKHQKEFIQKLKADKYNPIGIILRANSGIKEKQLVEFLIAMGMKPTLTGEVMPIAIQSSSLIGGLSRPSYRFIDATGARKPLVMNKKSMGTAGYFGKKMAEISGTVSLSTDVLDCGTIFTIPYEIKSKKHLKKLNGKFYKLSPEEKDYHLLKMTDTDLIGKTIYARAGQVCACENNKICARCIGNNANLNWDIAKGIGFFEALEQSKDLEQKILSGKHLLTTRSETIEFTDEFYKYFQISVGEISLTFENITSINDLAIYINPDEVKKIEELDEDSTYNTYISSGRFFIRNLKTGYDTEIKILQDKEIYITTETAKIMRDNNGIVKFKDVGEEMQIFEVVILNNELTKPLYELMALIDSANNNMEDMSLEAVSQKYLDILVESGIGASMISAEIILNRITRRPDNVMKRPDFSGKKMPDYSIYTITKVLENNESISIGLGFENLKRQLLNSNLDERTEPSFLDQFFKKELDTKKMEEYETPEESMMSYYMNMRPN